MKKYLYLIFILLLLTGCANEKEKTYNVNKDIVFSKEFSIINKSCTDTSFEGSIFVYDDKLKIVGNVTIEKDDIGGISINIPKGISIDNVISTNKDIISIWKTGKEADLESVEFIEIARKRNKENLSAYKGMVVIDMNIEEDIEMAKFKLAIGYKEENNMLSIGTYIKDIEVNLGTKK